MTANDEWDLVALSWWPAHLSAPAYMQMKMVHWLSPVLSVIDHDTESIIQDSFLSSYLLCYQHEVSEELEENTDG